MIPLDQMDPLQLSKRELLRRIDEFHNYREWRPLSSEEVEALEECQQALQMKMEVEKITGVRE